MFKKIINKMTGPRTRRNYWSCSNFAEWVRDRTNVTPKPKAATIDEWDEWEIANSNRVGYWITEKMFNRLQDVVMFIPDVVSNITRYLRARFIERPYVLDTKLPRGNWYDFDTRILYGLFEELVDFVEIEKAWMNNIATSGCRRRWLKRRRSPSDGIKHLQWEISLGDESPHQANAANEVLELYNWWVHIRPHRLDPMDESGWSEYCAQTRAVKDITDAGPVLNKLHEMEQRNDDEDTDHLIRLIRIRKSLWT